MRLVLCLTLLALLTQLAAPARRSRKRNWGFWGRRIPAFSGHPRPSTPQNTRSHNREDQVQPLLKQELLRTGAKTLVESSISGAVGGAMNMAFGGGPGQYLPPSGVYPGQAGSAGHQGSQPSQSGGMAGSQPSQSGGTAGSQPSQSGGTAESQPSQSGGTVGSQPGLSGGMAGPQPGQGGEHPNAKEISDVARKARVRHMVATSMSSSACSITAPLVTRVLTALALALRLGAE